MVRQHKRTPKKATGRSANEVRWDNPRGYRLGSSAKGWKVVCIPELHQVWIHPDTPWSRRTVLEGMPHARVPLFRPAQVCSCPYELRTGTSTPERDQGSG